ncbi:MAG: Nif3-like dinuclear metal center hexameric protein [Desulfosarcinaceae bacterium]
MKNIRLAGCLDKTISRVAVCSGAGGSLMQRFLESDAELFISGDLRYHDARTVEEAGKTLIDLGHFASERIIIDSLVEKIAAAGREAGWTLSVEPCRLEQDPFEMV